LCLFLAICRAPVIVHWIDDRRSTWHSRRVVEDAELLEFAVLGFDLFRDLGEVLAALGTPAGPRVDAVAQLLLEGRDLFGRVDAVVSPESGWTWRKAQSPGPIRQACP
jgi:hypothetical protein